MSGYTIWYVRDLSESGLSMTSDRALLCFDAWGLPATTGSCEPGNVTVISLVALGDSCHRAGPSDSPSQISSPLSRNSVAQPGTAMLACTDGV